MGSLCGKAPPSHPAPSESLSVYVGDYANDYYGNVRILQHHNALAMTLGPKATEIPLRHWDGNVFVYTPSGENAPDGSISKVTFTTGPSGPASVLAIEFYAESGMDRFVRGRD